MPVCPYCGGVVEESSGGAMQYDTCEYRINADGTVETPPDASFDMKPR